MGFVATAMVVAGAASAGATVYSGQKAATASKKASNAAMSQNNEAIAQLKASQDTASTKATESIRRRTSAMSQTVFTSPLGLPDQAMVARKTLTGQ